MQLRFFCVPVHGAEPAATELNRFLASHRVLRIERQFVADGASSAWAICVHVDEGGARTPEVKRGKIDYREALSAPEFAVFARLRIVRKELAEAEGVPAYAVFTNEQLAAMVQRRASSAADLRAITNVGEARADKCAEPFLRILRQAALPAVSDQGNGDAA